MTHNLYFTFFNFNNANMRIFFIWQGKTICFFLAFFVFKFCLQQTKFKNKPLLKSYFYYLNLGGETFLDIFFEGVAQVWIGFLYFFSFLFCVFDLAADKTIIFSIFFQWKACIVSHFLYICSIININY